MAQYKYNNDIIQLLYDYYPYVFQYEIDNRRQLKRFFL